MILDISHFLTQFINELYFSIPFTFYLLPFTFYLLPFTFYLLPFTFYLLPCLLYNSYAAAVLRLVLS
ncbi:hypothetical protein B7R75_14250, partial [Yersinia pseudotuberculosis]